LTTKASKYDIYKSLGQVLQLSEIMYRSKRERSTSGWVTVGSRQCTEEKKEDQKLDQDHLQLVDEVKKQKQADDFLRSSPDIAPTFSRQLTGEVQSTNMRQTAESAVGFGVASVDQNQHYTSALQGWMELPWSKVIELQVGTWIQYTNTVYPDLVKRKKVLCLVGNGILPPGIMEVDGERIMFFWTILQDQKEAEKKGLPIKDEWYACSRGRHEPLLVQDAGQRSRGLMSCRHCTSKGWIMTPGKVHQDRRFYVNQWARFIARN
jgi:hypothetical protein